MYVIDFFITAALLFCSFCAIFVTYPKAESRRERIASSILAYFFFGLAVRIAFPYFAAAL